jgi:hypothetical protein
MEMPIGHGRPHLVIPGGTDPTFGKTEEVYRLAKRYFLRNTVLPVVIATAQKLSGLLQPFTLSHRKKRLGGLLHASFLAFVPCLNW